MDIIRFLNDDTNYEVQLSSSSGRVTVKFNTDIPIAKLPNGFQLLNEHNYFVQGDFSGYKYIYKTLDAQSVILTTDSTDVYIEPEPIPDPEPYVPTEQELAIAAKQSEIDSVNAQISALDTQFRELDYIGIKIATGRATIEEYPDEIALMSSLAEQKDILEVQLSTLQTELNNLVNSEE